MNKVKSSFCVLALVLSHSVMALNSIPTHDERVGWQNKTINQEEILKNRFDSKQYNEKKANDYFIYHELAVAKNQLPVVVKGKFDSLSGSGRFVNDELVLPTEGHEIDNNLVTQQELYCHYLFKAQTGENGKLFVSLSNKVSPYQPKFKTSMSVMLFDGDTAAMLQRTQSATITGLNITGYNAFKMRYSLVNNFAHSFNLGQKNKKVYVCVSMNNHGGKRLSTHNEQVKQDVVNDYLYAMEKNKESFLNHIADIYASGVLFYKQSKKSYLEQSGQYPKTKGEKEKALKDNLAAFGISAWHDKDGYDQFGFKDGYDHEGFDINGLDRNGRGRDGYRPLPPPRGVVVPPKKVAPFPTKWGMDNTVYYDNLKKEVKNTLDTYLDHYAFTTLSYMWIGQ